MNVPIIRFELQGLKQGTQRSASPASFNLQTAGTMGMDDGLV